MPSKLQTYKRIFLNIFILTYVSCALIDTLPALGNWHTDIKESLDYYLDKTGLWQGAWQLFAPNADSVNSIITAQVTLEDNREFQWRSPNWRSMSTSEHFLRFREAEFFDSVKANGNKAAWKSFSKYLIKHIELYYRSKVRKITVQERYVVIADPRYLPFLPYEAKLPYVGTKVLFSMGDEKK